MSIKEKVAYLKGLAEGLGLDAESKEGRLMSVIIDTLADMADDIEALSDAAVNMEEELDAITDTLADVEEFLFDDEYDDDDYDDFDAHDDCECECDCCQGEFACEVECPACGEEITIDEATLISGSANCPACGKELEFELDEDDETEAE
ncbi:MAG: hypothetical protein FWC90_05360 [Oscillospiraceae bacterium]|nr:hypothetical protein [Oscillospiraceae bacterium]